MATCPECGIPTAENGEHSFFEDSYADIYHRLNDLKARAEAVERELQEVKQDRTLQGEESDREIHEMRADRDAAREALRIKGTMFLTSLAGLKDWAAALRRKGKNYEAQLVEECFEKVRRALEGKG